MPLHLQEPENDCFLLCQETEVCPLLAGDPVFKDFVPDDYKAFIRFRICTAFPNVIGPEAHGRFFGFTPQVLLNSYRSLLFQQTNLGHMLKIYGAYRDRIQGGIVAVNVANLRQVGGKAMIPDTVEQAPYLDVVAVLWKMAEGNKELLGKHLSAREKTNVSIEVVTTAADLAVYNPNDKSIHSMDDAIAQWPDLIKRDKKRGLQIGKVDGVQFAFAAGGSNGSVPFRGVGYVPRPAEQNTAKIIDLAASSGEEQMPFAAMVSQEWNPGQPVSWKPIFHGQDAGRGVVHEVLFEGTHKRHGVVKRATPGDPLLVIAVHGKKLEVIRHAASVKKIHKYD